MYFYARKGKELFLCVELLVTSGKGLLRLC